jgi:hypothetical protein
VSATNSADRTEMNFISGLSGPSKQGAGYGTVYTNKDWTP